MIKCGIKVSDCSVKNFTTEGEARGNNGCKKYYQKNRQGSDKPYVRCRSVGEGKCAMRSPGIMGKKIECQLNILAKIGQDGLVLNYYTNSKVIEGNQGPNSLIFIDDNGEETEVKVKLIRDSEGKVKAEISNDGQSIDNDEIRKLILYGYCGTKRNFPSHLRGMNVSQILELSDDKKPQWAKDIDFLDFCINWEGNAGDLGSSKGVPFERKASGRWGAYTMGIDRPSDFFDFINDYDVAKTREDKEKALTNYTEWKKEVARREAERDAKNQAEWQAMNTPAAIEAREEKMRKAEEAFKERERKRYREERMKEVRERLIKIVPNFDSLSEATQFKMEKLYTENQSLAAQSQGYQNDMPYRGFTPDEIEQKIAPLSEEMAKNIERIKKLGKNTSGGRRKTRRKTKKKKRKTRTRKKRKRRKTRTHKKRKKRKTRKR